MSRLLAVIASAVVLASALTGCAGNTPTGGGDGEEPSAGPTSNTSSRKRADDPSNMSNREPADDRFYENWTEEQRMVSDHTVQLPAGAAWQEGNAIEVGYLSNATPVDLSIVLTWDARHDLEQELEIENGSGEISYVGPSPLAGSFPPSPGEQGEERLFIWPGGDPVGFTHELSIQIEVSVLYQSPAPS